MRLVAANAFDVEEIRLCAYVALQSGHGFALVGSASQHNIPIGGTTRKPVDVLSWSRTEELENYRDLRTAPRTV